MQKINVSIILVLILTVVSLETMASMRRVAGSTGATVTKAAAGSSLGRGIFMDSKEVGMRFYDGRREPIYNSVPYISENEGRQFISGSGIRKFEDAFKKYGSKLRVVGSDPEKYMIANNASNPYAPVYGVNEDGTINSEPFHYVEVTSASSEHTPLRSSGRRSYTEDGKKDYVGPSSYAFEESRNRGNSDSATYTDFLNRGYSASTVNPDKVLYKGEIEDRSPNVETLPQKRLTTMALEKRIEAHRMAEQQRAATKSANQERRQLSMPDVD